MVEYTKIHQKNRLSKARNALTNLRPVWQSWSTEYGPSSIFTTVSLNWCFCIYRSAGRLLKRIFIRLRHFTMDAYAGSVGFSGPGLSQIWSYMPNLTILSQFKQKLKTTSTPIVRRFIPLTKISIFCSNICKNVRKVN